VRTAENLVIFMCRLSGIFGSPKHLETLGPVQASTNIDLAFSFLMVYCAKQKMTFEKDAWFAVASYPYLISMWHLVDL
jgi:hypothetical protein